MLSEVYNQSFYIALKAAYLYYIEDLPQGKIASILNVSVPTVSRLLARAKQEKIVEFVIRDPYLNCLDLGQRIKETFNLKDVVIATSLINSGLSSEHSRDEAKRLVALEGARYLQRIISENDTIGISYGRTMHYMVYYLNPCQKVNAKFITLHGSLSCAEYTSNVTLLSNRISMALGGEYQVITAEGIVSNKELARNLMGEKNIKALMNKFNDTTIAICGLGTFFPEKNAIAAQPEFLTEEEIGLLKEKNAVANLISRFIDSEGNECNTELKDRTIGIKLEQYKKIPNKIIIVSGVHKKYSLLAALKGKLIDVLITDYKLGNAILDIYKAEMDSNG